MIFMSFKLLYKKTGHPEEDKIHYNLKYEIMKIKVAVNCSNSNRSLNLQNKINLKFKLIKMSGSSESLSGQNQVPEPIEPKSEIETQQDELSSRSSGDSLASQESASEIETQQDELSIESSKSSQSDQKKPAPEQTESTPKIDSIAQKVDESPARIPEPSYLKKPKKRTIKQFLYNRETGEILGRTPISWGSYFVVI